MNELQLNINQPQIADNKSNSDLMRLLCFCGRTETKEIKMDLIIVISLAVMVLTGIILALINEHLPKWFCDKMGWHLAPTQIGFDGCSLEGTCPRCGKHVLQDSQGNWF